MGGNTDATAPCNWWLTEFKLFCGGKVTSLVEFIFEESSAVAFLVTLHAVEQLDCVALRWFKGLTCPMLEESVRSSNKQRR